MKGILVADSDKAHRCPDCWRIPGIIWEKHGHAHLWTTYTCPNGHRFARWVSPRGELNRYAWRIKWRWQNAVRNWRNR